VSYEQSNVGMGMVPHKKSCGCDECKVERLAAELAACRELLGKACGYLREVGNDYPGSSCQLWCHSKADECEPDRRNALCPSRANDGRYSKAECVSAGTCECGAAIVAARGGGK
jgi:hypothetical protein